MLGTCIGELGVIFLCVLFVVTLLCFASLRFARFPLQVFTQMMSRCGRFFGKGGYTTSKEKLQKFSELLRVVIFEF